MTSVCLPTCLTKRHVQTAWRNFMRFCINILRGMCHKTKNVLPQNINPKRYYFQIYREYMMH